MTNIIYEHIPIEECGEKLVNLKDYDFVLDARYFDQGYTTDKEMYLRGGVADRLLNIQKAFNGAYRFKIWDGFRSREVQNKMYQMYWNDLKVKHPDWNDEKLAHETGIFLTIATNPAKIPPHATGGAVDLTLVDGNGQEINMGTDHDHFGPEAHPLYYEENDIEENIRQNRRLLREALLKNGFRNSKDEWWHFDYGDQVWAVTNGEPYAIYGEAAI